MLIQQRTRVEVELLGELVPVVDLDERVARPVVLEALEVELEHGREVVEEHALARGLLPVPLRLVRIVTLERLDLGAWRWRWRWRWVGGG
jgi:hypothetical protein